MLVRYSNCKAWQGLGLGFTDRLMVEGAMIVDSDAEPELEVDCGGRVIIPAFVDAHMHPVLAGRENQGPMVTQARTIEQVQKAVGQWLSEHGEPHWVVGGAYNRAISELGQFRAEWLDEVSRTRPIVLHADDHHTIWVNSLAMKLAGVLDDPTAATIDGVDLDERGKPLGIFREADAKNLILKAVPRDEGASDLEAIHWAHRELLGLGITSVLDAWVDAELAETYLAAAKKDLLQVETHLAFWLEPELWQEQLAQAAEMKLRIGELGSEKLYGSTVKLFVDGVFGSATALVSERYESSGGFGSRFWAPEQLAEACLRASELGFQLHLHAIGDSGVNAGLDALEGCAAHWLRNNNRPPVMAHVELVDDAALIRLAALKVAVNLQPLWARPDDLLNSCRRHLGNRVENLYRTRDLLSAGVSVAFGSDWPVSSPNPFLGLYTAVFRSLPSQGSTQNSGQAIDFERALHAYTVQGAAQLGIENKGRLFPGNRGDFLILSGDPFEAPEGLPQLNVLETISGGQTKFTRHKIA